MTELETIMSELLRRILQYSDRLPPTLAARVLVVLDAYDKRVKEGDGE